jgi:hypothetical protein
VSPSENVVYRSTKTKDTKVVLEIDEHFQTLKNYFEDAEKKHNNVQVEHRKKLVNDIPLRLE